MSAPALEIETAQMPPYFAGEAFEYRAREVSEHCICAYDHQGCRYYLSFDCEVHAPDMAFSFYNWKHFRLSDWD